MTSLAEPLPRTATRSFAFANAAATLAVLTFLTWLIYFNQGAPGSAAATSTALPALNAILNATSAVLLTCAFVAVKRRRYRVHAGFMIGALTVSACFLVSYVYYHLHHAETRFTGTGLIRPIYFGILISHVLLSAIALPMILTSMFLAL